MSDPSTSHASCLRPLVWTAVVVFFLATASTRGVILYGTDDPNANTTAPTGTLAGSGWQYEGQFNAYLGTPIAPNYFITAQHIGGAGLVGQPIVYQGTSYTTTAAYTDPNSDLCIYQISGAFPTYAPLYTNANPVGLGLTVFGRGTQRGAAVTLGSGQQGGWLWGTSDGVQRWGTNNVSQVVSAPGLGNLLYSTFDASGGANEGTLSVGDSGGGVFIKDTDGTWKLAGINYGVDSPFYTGTANPPAQNNGFNAALYNSTGLYEYDDSKGIYVAANNPTGFYSTEIATDLAFIDGVVPEPSSVAFLSMAVVLLGVACRRARAAR